MSDLEDRLKSWFAGEVSRAERDLASSKVRTSRVRRRRPIPGLALAGLLVAVVVVALAVRPSVAPDTGKGPARSPTSGPTSPSAPGPSGALVTFGPDGLPTSVDGAAVLRARDGLVAIERATDGTPFLVGGWLTRRYQRCEAGPIQEIQAQLLPCSGWSIVDPGDTVRVDVASDWVPLPDSGPIVVRIHSHDPRSRACSDGALERCERAAVVDAVLWEPTDGTSTDTFPDGIPRRIEGETVLRPIEAQERVLAALDDRPFLIGGWAAFVIARCGAPSPDQHESSLVPFCNPNHLNEAPLSGYTILDLVPRERLRDGPQVLRVHVRDPLAEDCHPEIREACERAVVVDDVVWYGSELSAVEPQTLGSVHSVLTFLRVASADQASPWTPGVDGCDPGWPKQSWNILTHPRIVGIFVFPTLADRTTIEPRLTRTGWVTESCSFDVGAAVSFEWVAIDNVIIQVVVGGEGDRSDQAFLRDLRSALESLKAP